MTTQRRSRSIKLALAVVLGSVFVLGMTRPWSRYKPLRQMGIFSESARVHNSMAMQELFPAQRIARSTQPHAFKTAAHSLPTTYTFAGQTRTFEELFERTVTTGFLVLQGDTLLLERYFQGASASSRMTSWSVAKSVVSLLIGIAHDAGQIPDLDAPLASLAPELRGAAYGDVPVRAALNMSSGIKFNEDYGDALSDIHLLFSRIFFFGGHGESVAHYLRSLPRETAPGTRFHYISSDTLALGLALRHATGTSIAAYAQQKLWQPLGMENDALWNMEDEQEIELGFCCLNASLRDYAKIGRLVARAGDWDGRRIVSEAWLNESMRRDPKRAPGSIANMRSGYQQQWWLPPKDENTMMAAGVWGQYIYVNRKTSVVIVKTAVDPSFHEHMDENLSAFEAIDAALSEPTPLTAASTDR